MIRPSAGTIGDVFGINRGGLYPGVHLGEDIWPDAGLTLVAPDDCTVMNLSTWDGNVIDLNMGDGTTVRLKHLASFGVVSGQPLKRGDKVGIMGETGRAIGVHVHWEVRVNGQLRNPADFIDDPTAPAGGGESPVVEITNQEAAMLRITQAVGSGTKYLTGPSGKRKNISSMQDYNLLVRYIKLEPAETGVFLLAELDILQRYLVAVA